MSEPLLSAIIITKNEAEKIRECLESLDWADEIIIVDSFSIDATRDICHEYKNVSVYQNKWTDNYSAQKNYALSKAKGKWILSLDADERVTNELRDEILKTINSTSFQGFNIPHKNYFLNTWIKHCGWYPNWHLRLFKKNAGMFQGKIHEKVEVNGKIGYLNSPFIHMNHETIYKFLHMMNNYTEIEARDMLEQKHKHGNKFKTRKFYLALEPVFVFGYMYILKKGFLDGYKGFMLCILSAFYYFIKYVKYFELIRNKK